MLFKLCHAYGMHMADAHGFCDHQCVPFPASLYCTVGPHKCASRMSHKSTVCVQVQAWGNLSAELQKNAAAFQQRGSQS